MTSVLVACTIIVACSDDRPPKKPPAPDAANLELPPAKPVRFAKLEQLTEWTGQPWASVAEFNLIDSTGTVIDRKAWAVSADSAGAHDSPANAIDGDPGTLWHTRWDGSSPPPPPHSLVVDLGSPTKVSGFRYLPRQDAVGNGTIAKYRFYVSTDGVNWGEPVTEGDFAGQAVPTLERTVFFARQTVNHAPVARTVPAQSTGLGELISLQIEATDEDSDPLAYSSAGLPAGLVIATKTGLITGTPITPGKYTASVDVADAKGMKSTLAIAWTVQPPAVAADVPPPAPGEVRFARLEALTEVNGKPWGSIAELNLLDASGTALPRAGWVASADSSDTNDRPSNAIDGNPATLWHSQWEGAAPPPPHSLIVQLARPVKLTGFRYLPRQDRQTNGAIGRFRFYISTDGIDWGSPVTEGDFTTLGPPSAEKTVRF